MYLTALLKSDAESALSCFTLQDHSNGIRGTLNSAYMDARVEGI